MFKSLANALWQHRVLSHCCCCCMYCEWMTRTRSGEEEGPRNQESCCKGQGVMGRKTRESRPGGCHRGRRGQGRGGGGIAGHRNRQAAARVCWCAYGQYNSSYSGVY